MGEKVVKITIMLVVLIVLEAKVTKNIPVFITFALFLIIFAAFLPNSYTFLDSEKGRYPIFVWKIRVVYRALDMGGECL